MQALAGFKEIHFVLQRRAQTGSAIYQTLDPISPAFIHLENLFVTSETLHFFLRFGNLHADRAVLSAVCTHNRLRVPSLAVKNNFLKSQRSSRPLKWTPGQKQLAFIYSKLTVIELIL